MDEPNIFSGLVFCADCGKPLVLHRASTMKKVEYNFKCYTYGKKGKLPALRTIFGNANSRRSYWMISDGLRILPE